MEKRGVHFISLDLSPLVISTMIGRFLAKIYCLNYAQQRRYTGPLLQYLGGKLLCKNTILYAKTSPYSKFAKTASRFCGRPSVFTIASVFIVVWLATGPIFGYSDTWQLFINTETTIVTFLMVFLIQNTQNRDTEAIQVKLDELIRATKGAHNALLDLEELEEESLNTFRTKYLSLAKEARAELKTDSKIRKHLNHDPRPLDTYC